MARSNRDDEAREGLRYQIDKTRARLMELEGQFEDRVRDHPVQSVAIAFGAGVVAGAVLAALIRRRR